MAVFISGGGSTLQALLELQHQISIPLVVSNKKNILGSLKAQRFGHSYYYFNPASSWDELAEKLKSMHIDQIFLAGFMKLLPKKFVDQFPDQIFNIHPSLLPNYPGINSADKNFQDKKAMGVTIHSVNAKMDDGAVLLQKISAEKSQVDTCTWPEAQNLLRRTEQHLLREFIYRRCL